MSTSEKVTLELLLLNGSNYTSWSTRVLDVFRDIGPQFEWIVDLSMSPPAVSIFFPANAVAQGPRDHLEARPTRVSLPAASAFCPHGLGLPRRGPHLYLNKFCQTSLPALSSSGQDWLFGWWRICLLGQASAQPMAVLPRASEARCCSDERGLLIPLCVEIAQLV
jgi:hypothetical protein